MPSRRAVATMMEELRRALFPGYFGVPEVRATTIAYHVGHALDDVQRTMHVEVRRALAVSQAETTSREALGVVAHRMISLFFDRLPEVQRLLGEDVRAAYLGDPAARSPDEAILCYPGLTALTNHRVAHELYRLDVPLIPRIISELAHSTTGIDIHPGAQLGERIFIDHGTGVVIGETCIVGNDVRIYQNVTLGAKSFPLDKDGQPVKFLPRHPIIEDNVVIYSGATILGRVTIGRGATLGGNVWITRDVAPGSRVTIQPARYETYERGSGI
ncbi:MAG: serine acetyltransferase [Deltaproteobacteria bacterium]|nr:serine acetyltransferase [Deltaproteobacteria bacterium]